MLESIERLRKLRDEVEVNDVDNPIWVCHKAEIIADEIEREIAERYIERDKAIEAPLDADGVVWTYVDEWFIDKHGEKHAMEGMIIDCNGEWMLRSPWGWYLASECRHVKQRAVEDVLRELLDEPFKWNAVTGKYEVDNEYNEKKLRRYANVLRDMFGGDGR